MVDYTASVSPDVAHLMNHPEPFLSAAEPRLSTGYSGLVFEFAGHTIEADLSAGSSSALTAWSALGGASIAVVADSKPVSNSLPNSLQFTIPAGTTGAPGFSNSGFWGTWSFTF